MIIADVEAVDSYTKRARKHRSVAANRSLALETAPPAHPVSYRSKFA